MPDSVNVWINLAKAAITTDKTFLDNQLKNIEIKAENLIYFTEHKEIFYNFNQQLEVISPKGEPGEIIDVIPKPTNLILTNLRLIRSIDPTKMRIGTYTNGEFTQTGQQDLIELALTDGTYYIGLFKI